MSVAEHATEEIVKGEHDHTPSDNGSIDETFSQFPHFGGDEELCCLPIEDVSVDVEINSTAYRTTL